MDYAIMDATIAKLNKKPPLWITRQNLIRELDDLTNDCISQSFSGTSRDFVYHDLRKNKGTYEHHLTTSPFWSLKMGDRIWDGQKVKLNDLNEKVSRDYFISLYKPYPNYCMLYDAQIRIMNEFMKKNEYETKNNIWRAVQHEAMLGLYGKVCDDVLNEILAFC
jgi:hypothetical protein